MLPTPDAWLQQLLEDLQKSTGRVLIDELPYRGTRDNAKIFTLTASLSDMSVSDAQLINWNL